MFCQKVFAGFQCFYAFGHDAFSGQDLLLFFAQFFHAIQDRALYSVAGIGRKLRLVFRIIAIYGLYQANQCVLVEIAKFEFFDMAMNVERCRDFSCQGLIQRNQFFARFLISGGSVLPQLHFLGR